MSGQNIPLRNLVEMRGGGQGNFYPTVGNSALAPAIGRPSSGSFTSTDIDSFFAASDTLIASFVLITSGAIGGGQQAGLDSTFSNIPSTQASASILEATTNVSNQNFLFTAPESTIPQFFASANLMAVPTDTGGAAQPIIISPWLQTFAVDTQNIRYGNPTGMGAGSTSRLPTQTAFRLFGATVGFTYYAYAAPSTTVNVTIQVRGFLTISYPTASPG